MHVKEGLNSDADKLDGKDDKLDGTGQRVSWISRRESGLNVIMLLIGQTTDAGLRSYCVEWSRRGTACTTRDRRSPWSRPGCTRDTATDAIIASNVRAAGLRPCWDNDAGHMAEGPGGRCVEGPGDHVLS